MRGTVPWLLLGISPLFSCSSKGDTTSPGAKCDQIVEEYAATLTEAKQCSLSPVEPDECGPTVTSDVTCSCQTHVSKHASDATAQLLQLQKDWASLGCDAGACAAKCAPPPIGSCAKGSSATTGTCSP